MVQTPEYSRGINCSNLILTSEQDYESEQDSIEMFHYNDIPYFLKMNMQQHNLNLQFCYDITSKRSLEQVLDYQALDYHMLQQILDSLDQACMQIENYMLAESDILLEPEFIFTESQSGQILYCYLPGYQADICQQFQHFMEYLLQRLDHKDEQAVQLAYGVYQMVTEDQTALHTVLSGIGKGMIKLDIYPQQSKNNSPIQNPVKEYKEDKAGWETENNTGQEKNAQLPLNQKSERKRKQEKTTQSVKTQQKEATKKQASEKLKNLLRKKIYTDGYRNIEDDTVFEAAEEETIASHPTVCLMPEAEVIQNQFIYQGTDRTRDFHCIEGKMILGSSAKESDICIPLPMVSRVHARVEVNAQGTYLEDMNSTNGTQVNGELLNYRERRMLQKGDIISLAGENYSFH